MDVSTTKRGGGEKEPQFTPKESPNQTKPKSQQLPPIGHHRPSPIWIPDPNASSLEDLSSVSSFRPVLATLGLDRINNDVPHAATSTSNEAANVAPTSSSRKRFPTLENIAALTATMVPGGASPRLFPRLSEPTLGTKLLKTPRENATDDSATGTPIRLSGLRSTSHNASVHDGLSEQATGATDSNAAKRGVTQSVPGSGRFRSPVLNSGRISLFTGNIQDLKSRSDNISALEPSLGNLASARPLEPFEPFPVEDNRFAPRYSNATLEKIDQAIIINRMHGSDNSLHEGLPPSRDSYNNHARKPSTDSKMSQSNSSSMLVTLVHPAEVNLYYGRYNKKVDQLSPVAEKDFDEENENDSPWHPPDQTHLLPANVVRKIEKNSSDISGDGDDMSDILPLPSVDSARDGIMPSVSERTGISDYTESDCGTSAMLQSVSTRTGLTDILDEDVDFACEVLVSKVALSKH